MPVIPNTSSSDLTLRLQSRTIYHNYIAQKQRVDQGCTLHLNITGGSAGTTSSDITILREGQVFTTSDEQAAVLAANTCPSAIPKVEDYAIPDFTYTANDILVIGEPGTWRAIASGLSRSIMNGTYTSIGSHYYTGDMSDTPGNGNASGNIRAFKRIKATDATYGWISRTGSNNYTGTYIGSTSTTISGTAVKGEYITITSPYSFILSSYSLVSGHRVAQTGNYITSWVIAGSSDNGTTYTRVDVQTNVTMTNGTVSIQLPLNTVSYNTYIIVVTANKLTGADGANIDSWNLFTYF